LDEKAALGCHRDPRPGKIEVVPTKPCMSQSDLHRACYDPSVRAALAGYVTSEMGRAPGLVEPIKVFLSRDDSCRERR
jgi:hypothetical protein